ncbi:MAG TPA: cation:proton antiporter [Armatimonadota bacterium]|nr:cation:proton antiporter [Armatimonadota bacterium]
MHDHDFLIDLGLALLAALVGGMVARLLRLPLLIGYLLAGIAVGPHTPGFIADEVAVHNVAKLGVALLMFAVGTHLSLKELSAVRRIAVIGGGSQILGTVLLGLLLGMALGWGLYGGLFLGCALALSSTAVMMRLLEERGELGTGHGTAMMGVLVVQDLAVVLMVALLPSLATISTEGVRALGSVGLSVLKAGALVTVTLLLALRGVPALLNRVARTGSQELFLLVVVCICLAAGYLAQSAGLSLELGAFLAGLVVSESDYAHEVFNQVRPLRDLFASLFFVSVGMLLDPLFVARNWLPVLVVVLAIVVGKGLIAGAAVYAAGVHGRTAVLAGVGLAQIGEFSFILASLGDQRGLIPAQLSSVILAAALITMLLTPFVFGSGDRIYRGLDRLPWLSPLLNRPPRSEAATPTGNEPTPRVVILGCGRVGRYVSDALRAVEVPHVVVDYDANAVTRLRSYGVPIVYGDATSAVVLKQARPEQAELAVVALPEAAMTQMAVRALKGLAPGLPVVARVHRGVDIPKVREAGADAVIHEEFEAGTEMIRQGLDRLGFPDRQVDTYLEGIRQVRYRQAGA